MIGNPFAPNLLDEIFQITEDRPDILNRRESTQLEIKENFHQNEFPEYGRTIAAFANRFGGYLLFGVKNQPHRLLGMQNNRFREMDPNVLTQFLNNYFAPSIHWENHICTVQNKDFGLIYVHQGLVKPIVCSRTTNPLREGDIYYRYQAETRLITSADLHALIEERIERERDSWRRLLQRTARVSPTATYLLDINQGRAHGDRLNFVISEELLNKIKFIDAGKFEEAGEPTLRVLGNVEVVRTEVVGDPARLAPIDPTRQCTLYEKDVLARLKEKIADTIPLGSGIQKPLTGIHLRSVIKAHQIPTPSQYYYRPNVPGSRVYYGEPLIDWIVTQFQADPQFFFKAYTVAIKEM
jgi:hypothetical protein